MVQLIINSVLLGAALAMDAFSVSIANGIIEPNMRKRRMFMIAGVYALFQLMMPMIGWFLITTVEGIFNSFKIFIPWIALILLLFIGGKMVIEGITIGILILKSVLIGEDPSIEAASRISVGIFCRPAR